MSYSAIGEANMAYKVRAYVVGRLLRSSCFNYLGSLGNRLGYFLLEPIIALLGGRISGNGVRFSKASI